MWTSSQERWHPRLDGSSWRAMSAGAPRSPPAPAIAQGARRLALRSVRIPVALAGVLVLWWLWAASHPPGPVVTPDPEGRVLLSLFALGDTGDPPRRLRALQQQMRVARALGAEAQRRPADALVLLGDNFYPDGLRAGEIETRVRANLVEPYCVFLDLSAPLSQRVAEPCSEEARPIPLYAVLGNHDLDTADSARLQQEVVPKYVANWHLWLDPQVVELPHGVSLVLYDPRRLAELGDFEPLVRAVRAARGPWRILVSHYPFTGRMPARAAERALESAGVPVQLQLSGHEHNLQIGVLEGPLPMLQVVSGAGSDLRLPRRNLEGRRFAARLPGFARVDLVERPDGRRLVASLIAIREFSWQLWLPTRVVSRWSVDESGRAVPEPPSDAAPPAAD